LWVTRISLDNPEKDQGRISPPLTGRTNYF
jgi:hypothetical protein